MSIQQKESLFRWLPTIAVIVGFVVQIGTFSVWVGRLDQRIIGHVGDLSVHMPLEKKLEMFVSRTEYNAKVNQRDSEFHELRRSLESLNTKLDRLIERRNGE